MAPCENSDQQARAVREDFNNRATAYVKEKSEAKFKRKQDS